MTDERTERGSGRSDADGGARGPSGGAPVGESPAALLPWILAAGTLDAVVSLRVRPELAGPFAERLATLAACLLLDAPIVLAILFVAGAVARRVAHRRRGAAPRDPAPICAALALAAIGTCATILANRTDFDTGVKSLEFALFCLAAAAGWLVVGAAVAFAAARLRGSRAPARGARAAGSAAILAAGVLALATGFPGTAPAAARRRENVILISIDTLRADHLGSYGYSRPTSPNLDAFARAGVLFERAYAPSNWTLPSHASMLTGLDPLSHGTLLSPERLDRRFVTVAERMRALGYRTAAFVGESRFSFVGAARGFDQGFEVYEHSPHPAPAGRGLVGRLLEHLLVRFVRHGAGTAPNTIHSAEAWLAARRSEPFFLFLHFYDVHSKGHELPYEAPGGWNDRFCGGITGCGTPGPCPQQRVHQFVTGPMPSEGPTPEEIARMVCLYDGAIGYLDEQLGRFFGALDRLGLTGSTLVIVTSDHGEEFFEHGQSLHQSIYDEVLRVPMILRGPGIAPGVRVAAPVSVLDVAPTILAAARAAGPGPVRGVLVPPPADGGSHPPPFAVGSLNTGGFALVRGDLKVLVNHSHDPRQPGPPAGMVEAYDLASDPHERSNLVDRSAGPAGMPPAVSPLLAEIESLRETGRAVRTGIAGPDGAAAPLAVPEETKQRLRSLGYIQ